MNRLINKKVYNSTLGEGTITNAEDTDKGIFITVEFSESQTTKRYGFPIAIGKALSTNDNEIKTIADEIARAKEEALRIAEEKRKAAELQARIEQSKSVEEQGNREIMKADRKLVFNTKTKRIFKVHQGQTFNAEFAGGYVWAPESGIHHHEKMREIKAGDIIFHYAEGALVAVGEAVSDCFEYPQPSALYGHGWGDIGYRIEVRYQVLSEPLSLGQFREEIINNRAESYSSFDSNGGACQGYMYELEDKLAKLFSQNILKTNQPADVVRVLNRI